MENKINKVKEVIEKDGLITKSRYRTFLDRRSYLYAMLHKEGMSLVEIGQLFDKTHATIINGIRNHYAYTRYKDELYLYNIQEYIQIFNNSKKLEEDMLEKVEPKYTESQLIEDILNCDNLLMLAKIKRRITRNEYLFAEATLTE